MNIQLALDRLSIEEAISITRKAEPYIDWIEVGTSLIKEFGMESVRSIRKAFPDKTIVADMKTFDNATYEFELCFEAGADVATVMGAAPSVSIEACLGVAERHGKQVMIDLLNTSPQQIASLSEYENAILCAHLSKDQQESGKEVRLHIPSFSNKNSKLAVAGGISVDTFSEIAKLNPYVVIIGSAITKTEDPEKAAAAFYEMKGRVEHE
ncbi:3-hexulose-6-phosphate synthase [Bacillus sp. NEB1478]|uniref:3-hexulose-6-phosphate synthase n=1 Tax=Bacillus sp. NEB1478 TaxID=3073816 RepID=UPI002872FCF2|nr:3-hexulose-6-phosphate synthase [Bacillus sp. NEB1478]WNB91158.1 3-hexulose-6-phosphate synthase [Bacillus sp. NEB1478]